MYKVNNHVKERFRSKKQRGKPLHRAAVKPLLPYFLNSRTIRKSSLHRLLLGNPRIRSYRSRLPDIPSDNGMVPDGYPAQYRCI